MKLFCMCHAGGFAMRYRKLAEKLKDVSNGILELIPIEYNGRGSKSALKPYDDFHDLTEQIGNEIAGILGEKEPYCLFGHCMGGYAASEVAYYMNDKYQNVPVMLVISTPYPLATERKVTGLTRDEVITFLRENGGTDEGVLQGKIFETELLPILQHDLSIFDTYTCSYAGKKLNTHAVISYGEDDRVLTHIGRLSKWQNISENPVMIHKFKGNHFYFEDHLDEYADFLCAQYVEALELYENRTGGYPLTDVQKSYLLGRNRVFSSGGISTHVYYEFKNKIDVVEYEKAWNEVIRKHPMLRTVIYEEGYQNELSPVPYYAIPVCDMRQASSNDIEDFIRKKRNELSHKVFEIGTWPMFAIEAMQLNDHETYLFYSFDLLIADGSSLRMILRECMDIYEGQNDIQEDLSFREYILKTETIKMGKRHGVHEKYWKDRIAQIAMPPELPYRTLAEENTSPRFERLSYLLDRNQWHSLNEKLQQNKVMPTTFFLATYAAILSVYIMKKSFCLNVTLTNRVNYGGKLFHTVGDFTSLLLLEMNLNNSNSSFLDVALAIQKKFMEDYKHRAYDGILVEQEISQANKRQVLYPIVFTSLLGMLQSERQQKNVGELMYSISQTPQVYLDFQLMETKKGVMLTWDYLTSKFETWQIKEMFQTMVRQVEQICANGFDRIPFLPEASPALNKMVETYNHTNRAFPLEPMHELFKHSVQKYMDRPAVSDENGQLSYGELDELSDQVAYGLLDKGVKPGELVGIYTYRKKETVAGILGILKAGAAYVPISPAYPKERQVSIIQKANIRIMITDQLIQKKTRTVLPNVLLDSLAYVIFTSGSSGEPKGVVITHKEAANTIFSINERFAVTEEDVVLGISSMCFDLSVYDIFGTFAAGALLVILPDLHDVRGILRLVQEKQVTVWNSVPAIMQLVLEVAKDKELESLTKILLSGDKITVSLAKDIRKKLPAAKLYSLGGATEGSIWSIYYELDNIPEKLVRIPYGYPLDNQRCYILDENDRICTWGVSGEIVIAGDGVADGYLKDEELTAKQFRYHEQLGRIYYTGDLGLFNRDGVIEILGRKDGQLKINGFRIESGEIEKKLEQHPAVSQAVIEVLKVRGKKRLAAFLVQKGEKNEKLQESVRHETAEKLPYYMLPSFYVWLDEIPLTHNGKVDRKKLREYIPKESLSKKNEPQTETESALYTIFEKVLGDDKFGMENDLVQMGIDSISILKIIAEIQEVFSVSLSLQDIMKNSSIRKLSKLLEQFSECSEQGKIRNF